MILYLEFLMSNIVSYFSFHEKVNIICVRRVH